jgi:hypothetical protein
MRTNWLKLAFAMLLLGIFVACIQGKSVTQSELPGSSLPTGGGWTSQ